MSQSLPETDPLITDDKKAFRTWMQWLSWIHRVATSITQSGTTADRPTTLLWLGRRYFDVTLNKPVYLSAVTPSVWRDAMGNIV